MPVISDGPYGFEHLNAAEQRRDPNSMLNWIERIIRMRKEVPEVGWGDFEVLELGDRLPSSASATTGATTRCCSCTTSRASRCEIEFASGLKDERAGKLINLLGTDHSEAGRERQTLRLPGRLWLSLVPRAAGSITC